ncbi:uncharacterized protein [Euwallacea similis]|uniref:uncharacterized protein n=1 Tax=Euwallacea similis TaxID=1736056 RepID=UPI00344C9A40
MSQTDKVMDFRIILQNNTEQSTIYQEENPADYTVTFVVGSCVLAVFLLLGVVASAYLCMTLKKGTFLWVSDSNRQLNKDKTEDMGANDKDSTTVSLRDVKSTSSSQETTQV